MKRFFLHFLGALIVSVLVYYLIDFFAGLYDYDGSLGVFFRDYSYVVYGFLGVGVFYYMLQLYQHHKYIQYFQNFTYFVLVGIIFQASLVYLMDISLVQSTFLTASLLISTLLIFPKNPFFRVFSLLGFLFSLSWLALLSFPSYPHNPTLQDILSHQHNTLTLSPNQTQNNNTDDIQVSCLFGNTDSYESLDLSDDIIQLPITPNTKCIANTELSVITRDNRVLRMGSGKRELQDIRNYKDIGDYQVATGVDVSWSDDIYAEMFLQTAIDLYSWQFTSKQNLEDMTYRKHKILDQDFEKYLRYRLLVGKNIVGGDIEKYDDLYLLGINLKPRIQRILPKDKTQTLESIDRKQSIKEIEGAYNGLGKTRFLKRFGQ